MMTDILKSISHNFIITESQPKSLTSECLDWCCNMNFSEIIQNPIFLSVFGVFILLILWQVYSFCNRIVLIDENSHGKIYLKRSQLIKIIKVNCTEILPNIKPTIILKSKKNQLHVLIKMQCIRDVRPICFALQEQIYNALINQTGITNICSINIIIKKIILDVLDVNAIVKHDDQVNTYANSDEM